MVREISYIFALFGTFALVASGAAWWNAFRRPQLQSPVGRLDRDTRGDRAAMALVAAFGLSLVAAILAIFTWTF